MFVDEVQIFAQAGAGGSGAVAFHREAYRPKGGPSGGNGGRGGSVILQADHDLNNLIAQFYVPRLIAKNGAPGQGKGMDGHAGKDLVVKVPCGTVVWRLPSALSDSEEGEAPEEAGSNEPGLVADLTVHGQQLVLCKGGRGGYGNRHFASATHQTPRFAQSGGKGEVGRFLLELRLMADIALVGFPNAGKSTLLAAISRAHPRIAAYPFTTLNPQVGIIEYSDYKRLVVCDVPGLIEGAHRNVGLGHAFLRHIRRCHVLVLLLDMAGADGRLPWEDYKQLLDELGCYDRSLLDRPRLVVANKMDEPAAEGNLRRFKRRIRGVPVMKMAAAFDEGIEPFKQALRQWVEGPRAEATTTHVP